MTTSSPLVEAPPVVVIDYDGWRAAYDNSTLAEQKAGYELIRRSAPDQPCVDLDAANHAFADVYTVTEIGGWRGELADAELQLHPALEAWHNYDICDWAVGEGSECSDERYHPHSLDDWPWNIDLEPADLFVASHVIEHMRFVECALLAEQFVKFRKLHLQIPLPLLGRPYWGGYPGTHIMEAGWEDVHGLLDSIGFKLVIAGPLTCRTYERTG